VQVGSKGNAEATLTHTSWR